MTRKYLKAVLPNLPDEYFNMVFKVVSSERKIGYINGVNAIKYLLKQIYDDVPSNEVEDHCVTHVNNLEGG